MLRYLLRADRRRYGSKDLAGFFLLAATIAIGVAMLLFSIDDGDGGTGPRSEREPVSPPAPSIIPDRPPAEWFEKAQR